MGVNQKEVHLGRYSPQIGLVAAIIDPTFRIRVVEMRFFVVAH